MTDGSLAAEPRIKPARSGVLSRISLVWLVPVIALAVSLGVAWQSYSDRGVLVRIAFDNASGVAAGKTELKYRDVTVGLVEEVSFSDDLSEVLVDVRVKNDIAPFLDDEAQFWVVRPEVSVRGVSGLNTVLSGVYIEGSWDSSPGASQAAFKGRDAPPLVLPGRPGTRIVLRSREGHALAAGAPILFKGIRVGFIETPRLTPSGNAVTVNGFVDAPYDQLVNTATRFWDTSGFSVSLGAGGIRLDVSSLASLVEGGIAFDTLVSGGAAINPGVEFPIYADEATARESLFQDPLSERLRLAAIFDGSVGGLVVGADVRFRGIKVGEVTALNMIATEEGKRRKVRLRAGLALRPGGLGLGQDATVNDAMALLKDYVAQGLRARLTSANILTGELIVELIELPDAVPASIVAGDPLPVLPSVEANVSDFNATAEGVFERINALPVEDLINSAIAVLDGVNAVVKSEGANSVLPELTATLAETRAVMAELRSAGATEKLNAALTSAEDAAAAVATAVTKLPGLAARIETLAARTEAVLASYGENSRLIAGALDTLRGIDEAAEALKNLARALQRNPNSLLLGR